MNHYLKKHFCFPLELNNRTVSTKWNPKANITVNMHLNFSPENCKTSFCEIAHNDDMQVFSEGKNAKNQQKKRKIYGFILRPRLCGAIINSVSFIKAAWA